MLEGFLFRIAVIPNFSLYRLSFETNASLAWMHELTQIPPPPLPPLHRHPLRGVIFSWRAGEATPAAAPAASAAAAELMGAKRTPEHRMQASRLTTVVSKAGVFFMLQGTTVLFALQRCPQPTRGGGWNGLVGKQCGVGGHSLSPRVWDILAGLL